MTEHLKCVVLGEPNCGKTSMINLFMTGSTLISDAINTRYNVNFIAKLADIAVDSSELDEFKAMNSSDEHLNYSFKMYDYEMNVTNEEQFLKENELDKPDVLIYCYKSGSRLKESLIETLTQKWGDVPVVLVSCKSDILESTLHNLSFETTSKKLSNKFGANLHLYCSSLKKINIDKVFNDSFKLAIRFRIKRELKKKYTESRKVHDEFLLSSKLFMSFTSEQDEKMSNSFIQSLFTLFGFALFLFYMITNKISNSISLGEINLIKGVIDESLGTLTKTYSSLFLQ